MKAVLNEIKVTVPEVPAVELDMSEAPEVPQVRIEVMDVSVGEKKPSAWFPRVLAVVMMFMALFGLIATFDHDLSGLLQHWEASLPLYFCRSPGHAGPHVAWRSEGLEFRPDQAHAGRS
jgi:hypothetical protein